MSLAGLDPAHVTQHADGEPAAWGDRPVERDAADRRAAVVAVELANPDQGHAR
jgi:hypothetical protein